MATILEVLVEGRIQGEGRTVRMHEHVEVGRREHLRRGQVAPVEEGHGESRLSEQLSQALGRGRCAAGHRREVVPQYCQAVAMAAIERHLALFLMPEVGVAQPVGLHLKHPGQVGRVGHRRKLVAGVGGRDPETDGLHGTLGEAMHQRAAGVSADGVHRLPVVAAAGSQL